MVIPEANARDFVPSANSLAGRRGIKAKAPAAVPIWTVTVEAEEEEL